MEERKSRCPCLLNTVQDCPHSCPRYGRNFRSIMIEANRLGVTPEEIVTEMRKDKPDIIKANDAIVFRKMFQQDRLEECQLFTEGKIDRPRP